MNKDKTSIILIGEGGIPTDFPKNDLYALLTLKSKINLNLPLNDEENKIFEELNERLKRWNRNFRNDEHYHILMDLKNMIYLKTRMKIELAFLDNCKPELYEAIEKFINEGFKNIVLISPNFLISKENLLKINDILDFIKRKYNNINLIDLTQININQITDFLVNIIFGVLDDK